MSYTFEPIGHLESPFREKFGIPRQSQLVPAARARLRLDPALRDGLKGLEGFSHVWIVFVFHGHADRSWNPCVRPPRLGGERTMGVLATRAPHRPNPIGLSLVRLDRVDADADPPTLHLLGGDFLDGTPVLDVKPHIPDADRARGPDPVRTGWLEHAPAGPDLPVTLDPPAEAALVRFEAAGYPDLRALVIQMLRRDPRPAFQRHTDGEYAARVLDFDVQWVVEQERCRVTDLRDLRPAKE